MLEKISDAATNLYFGIVVERRRRLYVDQQHRRNGASNYRAISSWRLDTKRLAANWRLTPDSARVIGLRQGAPPLRAPACRPIAGLRLESAARAGRRRLCPALRGLPGGRGVDARLGARAAAAVPCHSLRRL